MEIASIVYGYYFSIKDSNLIFTRGPWMVFLSWIRHGTILFVVLSISLVLLSVIHGPLVHEVHQQFGPWIYQITRLYKNKEHAEVEYTIGPIPIDDDVGKEIITRLTTDMVTNSTFYTDSNGRDFLKRVRNYREDWDLEVTEPVAGNYYPVNLGTYVADGNMSYLRILRDDGKGLNEPLGEVVCMDGSCKGSQGTYYVKVDKLGHGAYWRRTYGQQDETSWKSYNVAKESTMDENYSLPDNVAIITLQNLDDGTTLLRLAHLFQATEDPEYSVIAKVELKRCLEREPSTIRCSNIQIKELAETNLSANQKNDPIPLKGGPVDSQALVIELGPMEIRTFLLKF
ncbi:hypothetical protein BDA96_01G290000 [Sorghum bicolor]|uniref:Glycosyl hydrolases family 38 C-terminal beta sandwich domain-containing protein n=1 Tax=Sorghum bicolor TaxID=4558 RepID=A0A921V1P5_SORBI|nr:hypothetical protein BDA96_01G290000 [Sorghum bicolor]